MNGWFTTSLGTRNQQNNLLSRHLVCLGDSLASHEKHSRLNTTLGHCNGFSYLTLPSTRLVKDVSSSFLLPDVLLVSSWESTLDDVSEKSLKLINERDTGTDKVTEQTNALCGAEIVGSSLARELHIENLLGSLNVDVQNTGSAIIRTWELLRNRSLAV